MVIVVPAFSEGQERKPEVVSAGVRGLEPATAEHVRQGIDREGGVVQRHRRNQEPPHEELARTGAEPRRPPLQREAERDGEGCEQHGRNDVETVKEAQFRETRKVAHLLDSRVAISLLEEPEPVAAPEASLRAVRILLLVGEAVMLTVVRRPPQRAALGAGGADECQYELHGPRGREGAVREVAVEEGRDREFANQPGASGEPQGEGTPAGPDHGHTAEVKRKKRQQTRHGDALAVLARHLPSIKAAYEGATGALQQVHRAKRNFTI